jgi:hypothetical protein
VKALTQAQRNHKGLHKAAFIVPLLMGIQCAAYSEALAENQVDLSPVELAEVNESEPSKNNAAPDTIHSSEPIKITPPSLVTTRPSFTDAAVTVPQDSLQVESGATFADNRGGTYSWTLPETQFRLGVTDNTEFRYTAPNYTYIGDNKPGSIANNFGDSSIGLAHHMMLPGKVDIMLIPILNLPTGANKVSSNSVDPMFRLVGAKYLTPKWQISSMFETRWNTGKDAAARVVMMPTFINYYNFNSKWIGFLEYGSFIPTEGKSSQFIQSGALFLPTPRQQFDARVAVGLNKMSPNLLVGFGYSFRVDGLFGKSRDFSSFKR